MGVRADGGGEGVVMRGCAGSSGVHGVLSLRFQCRVLTKQPPHATSGTQVFMKYCRFGDRRNDGKMVEAKLTALCKDSGVTDLKRFTAARAGISFAKLKSKVKHITKPKLYLYNEHHTAVNIFLLNFLLDCTVSLSFRNAIFGIPYSEDHIPIQKWRQTKKNGVLGGFINVPPIHIVTAPR